MMDHTYSEVSKAKNFNNMDERLNLIEYQVDCYSLNYVKGQEMKAE